MRLLQQGISGTLSFYENANEQEYDVPYAILSHTWGEEKEEVTYQDVEQGLGTQKAGYAKIQFLLKQAQHDGYQYVWIDTCCINRWNATELGECLNLMYKWYANAGLCYAYLADIVDDGPLAFSDSRWMTRGWTLQEMVAPKEVHFYGGDGRFLGTKSKLSAFLHDITGVPQRTLSGEALELVPVADRFRWSLKRRTKKPEDASWCLAGLLGVNIQLQYGIGLNAARNHLLKQVKEKYGEEVVNSIEQALVQPVPVPQRADTVLEETKSLIRFPGMGTRRLAIEHALDGTVSWLLNLPAYKTWLDITSTDTFLWIKGHPGAGKSTLMKYADINSEKLKRPDTMQVSFYFNARGTDFQKSTRGMYRSLIYQMLEQVPAPVGRAICAGLLDSALPAEQDLTLAWLKELFRVAISECQYRNIRCFIDALDECDVAEVQDMVIFLRDVGKAVASACRLSVCFASRYYPALTIKSSVEVRLELQEHHRNDLVSFVDDRLDVDSLEDGEEIKYQLVKRANGIFMWAVLVVRALNQEIADGTVQNMQQVIENLPEELDGLYRAIIDRQDNKNVERFQACMQLLLFSRRPLEGAELYHALLNEGRSDCETNDQASDRKEPNPTTLVIDRFVSSASRGLAECLRVAGKHTVQVIHESVRDFFLTHKGLHVLFPSDLSSAPTAELISRCHDRMKSLCFDDLRRISKDMALNSTKLRLSSAKPLFRDYAITSLACHAEQAARVIKQDEFVLDLDDYLRFRLLDTYSTWLIGKHKFLSRFRNWRAVHVFAIFGCWRLMATAARLGLDLDARGDSYYTAILIASRLSHWPVVHELLLYGANLRDFVQLLRNVMPRRELVPGHSHVVWSSPDAKICTQYSMHIDQESVLLSFPGGWLCEITRLLIAYGANVSCRDRQGLTAFTVLNSMLPAAKTLGVESDFKAAIAVLLSHGAADDLTDEDRHAAV